ncbi:MAG: hypothetical protein AB8B73_04435 [Ekhidna sp.]
MSYFDKIYAKLFGEKTATPLVVQEILKRSDRFTTQFHEWKLSDLRDEMIDEIWQSYFWKKKGIEKTPQVFIMESVSNNGFSIKYEANYNEKDFHFLFDYLADQVKKLNYTLVLSRLTRKESGEDVDTKEMHYLKPKRGFVEPINQQYGNIQIEYSMINDSPQSIRLIANGYPDRNYTKVKDFNELVQHIFNIDP